MVIILHALVCSPSSIADTIHISSADTPPALKRRSRDHGLAQYRLKRFMSDNTRTTLPFYSNTSGEDIIHGAKDGMMKKLQAFDRAFGTSAAKKTEKGAKGTSIL